MEATHLNKEFVLFLQVPNKTIVLAMTQMVFVVNVQQDPFLKTENAN